jgi:hypothetical protein
MDLCRTRRQELMSTRSCDGSGRRESTRYAVEVDALSMERWKRGGHLRRGALVWLVGRETSVDCRIGLQDPAHSTMAELLPHEHALTLYYPTGLLSVSTAQGQMRPERALQDMRCPRTSRTMYLPPAQRVAPARETNKPRTWAEQRS